MIVECEVVDIVGTRCLKQLYSMQITAAISYLRALSSSRDLGAYEKTIINTTKGFRQDELHLSQAK